MTSSVFGPLHSEGDLEQAWYDTLRLWLPTYLAASERQHNIPAGTIPRPRSWNVEFDTDTWPEDQQPSIMVVCDGTGDIERRHGVYDAWFDVQVGVIVSARDRDAVRLVAQIYTAAISALGVQKGSLGGVAQETVLTARSYGFPDEDNRTLRLGVVAFRTLVDGILMAGAGPSAPIEPTPEEPNPQPSPYPNVQSVDIDLDT